MSTDSKSPEDPAPTASHCYQPHPLRIQRKRTKGWKLPEGAVCVSRPGRWGNPYKASEMAEPTHESAVECFRVLVESEPETIVDIKNHLKGKPLACWCPLDRPCHADVLAEIANGC